MAESDYSDDDIPQFLEQIGVIDWSDPMWRPKCTDPDVLHYRKEIRAYEGFYITDNDYLRQNTIGGICVSDPETDVYLSEDLKLAIEHHNQTASEAIEVEAIIRSNFAMVAGLIRYITFSATNGKFYETKVWVRRGALMEFYFLRPAIHYPNLAPLSSSFESSSDSE